MTLQARNLPDELVYALVAAHNQRQVDSIGSSFHLSRTEITNRGDYRNQSVTRLSIAANALSNDAARVVRANAIKAALNLHYADMVAHDTVQTATIATADATDLTSANTLINACKASYNTGGHINTAGVHFTNDATNTIAAANATDAASFDTLAAEMTTDINAHMASAPAGTVVTPVSA
jgi:hypothetical protein